VVNGSVGLIPGGLLLKYGEDEFKRFVDYGIDDVVNRLVAARIYQAYGLDKTKDLIAPQPGFAQ
jgi:hypothetical protein